MVLMVNYFLKAFNILFQDSEESFDPLFVNFDPCSQICHRTRFPHLVKEIIEPTEDFSKQFLIKPQQMFFLLANTLVNCCRRTSTLNRASFFEGNFTSVAKKP